MARGIRFIVVGRLEEAHWRQAQADYQSRLKRYAAFELIEVKDWHGKNQNDAAAREKEGEALLDQSSSCFRIALTPQAKVMDTPAWSAQLGRWLDVYPRTAFLMGGPSGLSQRVLKASDTTLALSPMTFPHELARVVFLEQLYRAFTILKGEKYHR